MTKRFEVSEISPPSGVVGINGADQLLENPKQSLQILKSDKAYLLDPVSIKPGFVNEGQVGSSDIKPINPAPIFVPEHPGKYPYLPIKDGPFISQESPIKYPLPNDGIVATPDEQFERLKQKITSQAVDNVLKAMTPQERKQLDKDAAAYEQAMHDYAERMRWRMAGTGGPRLDPKPPEKPESVRSYEAAVDKEITTLIQKKDQ